MREILFRGKTKTENEWVEGGIVPSFNGKHFYIGNMFVTHQVDLETVGQFTSLTDKNGKKIFEGDILQFDYIGENLGVNGISVCEFENGKFGVKWGSHKEFVCLDGFANTTLEVIGNIHDNPELLKGGTEQ